jgi:hypothetical protein
MLGRLLLRMWSFDAPANSQVIRPLLRAQTAGACRMSLISAGSTRAAFINSELLYVALNKSFLLSSQGSAQGTVLSSCCEVGARASCAWLCAHT